MAIQEVVLNTGNDAVADTVAEVSLHTTDGGTTGTGEITGGTYARQVPAYATSDNGATDLTANVVFGGPAASSDVTHLGFWGVGDVWLGSVALASLRTIGPGDSLTVTSAPITTAVAP